MDWENMSFNTNNNLVLTYSFQFLSSSLDSLIKNLGKDDFKHLNQKFDNNILDLVKEDFNLMSMSDFEKLKEELPCKEKLCSLTGKKGW